jgi:predicted dehydrogenase
MSLKKEMKLKIGIVGAGFMGQFAHIANYAEIQNCEIVALAEYRPDLRYKVATKFGIPRTYENHTQLLNDSEVEAVIVITPRNVTGPVAYDCLKANKHVFTEKPMAGTLEQGEKLVQEAKKNNLQYVVGYMKRYDEGVIEGKKILNSLIETSELGSILFVRAHCFMGDSFCNPSGYIETNEDSPKSIFSWPTNPEWVPTCYELDFSGYLNTYSHNTNLLRFLFDATPKVDYVNFTQMDGRIAVLKMGNILCSLETGRSDYHYWDETIQIYFKKGHLTIKTPPPLLRNNSAKVELYRAGEKPETKSYSGNWTWSFKTQANAFVNDVLHNTPSVNPGIDALEDLRLCEKMWKIQIEHNPKKKMGK